MADERERELQRLASSGDLEAETQLLLQRVRSGELSEARLRLAAYCADTAAAFALGEGAPRAPEEPYSWFDGLSAYGGIAWNRAALALIRSFVAHEQSDLEGAYGVDEVDDYLLTVGIEAWEKYLAHEREEDRRTLNRAVEAICEHDGDRPWMARNFFLIVTDWVLQSGQACYIPDELHCTLDEEPEVFCAWARLAQGELVPWALGYGDPLRERVERA